MSEKCQLTDEQIKELSMVLLDTKQNIYTLSRKRYGIEATDETFDRLEKIGLRRCVSCGTWGHFEDEFCEECV